MSQVKLQVEEVKKIQLEILDVVAKFCEENAINYWIDCGTLLGAIRHKGYIPWDDDIDVGMLREDYNRFAATFNETNSRFQFWCIENNPSFHLPHGKVLDTTTVLYEPDENGFKLSVNIDIFVYDNAPDDDKLVKQMFDRRDALRNRFAVQTQRGVPTGNMLIKALKYARRFAYRLFAGEKLIEKMVENSMLYASRETKRVGNFTSFSRTVCDKEVFRKFVDVDFEERRYKAPDGYDEWLRAFYGDYMQLPPVEKRVTHHSFVAYRECLDENQ